MDYIYTYLSNIANINDIEQEIADKLDKLVSGTNVKTINGESILGSGNLEIVGGGGPKEYVKSADVSNEVLTLTNKNGSTVTLDVSNKQNKLTAGDHIELQGNNISAQFDEEFQNIDTLLDWLTTQVKKLTAIKVQSLSCSPSIAQFGSTVTAELFKWTYNMSGTPATITINGQEVDKSLTLYTMTGMSVTGDTTHTIIVTDDYGTSSSANCSIKFMNKIYWGVSEASTVAEMTSDFIKSLSGELSNSFVSNKSMSVGDTLYIYYALPHRLGTPTFTISPSPFPGGMGDDKFALINFTNEYNYTEVYDIWRSDNPGLGDIKLIVA